MKELQKTAEEFINFLDTYIEDRSTPITPQTLEERGFRREERLIRIVCTKGDDPDHQVSVSFRHDGKLDAVEVIDWPKSHACIRETITTIEQLNQLLLLMHMDAV